MHRSRTGASFLVDSRGLYFFGAGAIGRRYRRQDEIGTPFCICVDYDTKEDNTVTIRERDSMEQIRIPIDEVAAYIAPKVSFDHEA